MTGQPPIQTVAVIRNGLHDESMILKFDDIPVIKTADGFVIIRGTIGGVSRLHMYLAASVSEIRGWEKEKR